MSTLQRVLMTGDTVGGVWTFTMELAEALGAHGVEVILAALGGTPSNAQRTEASEIPGLTLLARKWKLEWMDEPWDDVDESGKWLLELENRYRPDVVHLNSLAHGALPWQTPVVLTVHSCVASWWSAVKYEPLPVEWSRYRATVERSLRAVRAITAPSYAMLQTVGDNYGINLESDFCRVIPNGRRGDRFHPAIKEPFVLAAGRLWDEAKNIATVSKAAPLIPWPVYLAGEQQRSGRNPAKVDGCRLLGQLSSPELASWYARAAIYAFPARYEPFGLSVLEAALSGCALVLGDIASLRELWNGAAIFVPPDDSDALAAACRDLIADQDLRQRMARLSTVKARVFTSGRVAVAYLAIYQLAMRESHACAS